METNTKYSQNIPSLDGLRAAAIGIVFLSHSGFSHIIPGLFGVTIFFFLSGYLITTLLQREYSQNHRISLKRFYLRRALRLFPPLYIVLIAAVAAVSFGLLPKGFTWSSVLAQVFYYGNYYSIWNPSHYLVPGTEVMWSLAVEEHFYLIFPLLLIWMQHKKLTPNKQAMILLALCAAELLWRCYLVFGAHIQFTLHGSYCPRISHATDTRLDALLFGCLLACWYNPANPSKAISKKVIYAGLPLGGLLLISTFLIRRPDFRETVRYTLQDIALIPLFLAAIRYPEHPLFQPLNWKWVRWIGTISYSLYLVHDSVLEGIKKLAPHMSRIQVTIIGLISSLIISACMFRLVEKPMARLRRKFAPGKAQSELEKKVTPSPLAAEGTN